jgi:hypothetical protein
MTSPIAISASDKLLPAFVVFSAVPLIMVLMDHGKRPAGDAPEQRAPLQRRLLEQG